MRLPREVRFDAKEVRIRKHGNSVILEPVVHDWAWLDALVGTVDEDFARFAEEEPAEQVRPELDFFD